MDNSTDVMNDIHSHSVNIKLREIFLHNPISHSEEENPGVDYRMASTLIKNICTLDSMSDKPIVIRMFSIGGDIGSGMAIYDAMSACRSHVTMIAYGQAESMSGVILQGADKRVLSPNCYFMSHFGSTGYEGNYLDAQAAAKIDKFLCSTILDIYAEGMVNSQFFKDNYSDNSTHEKARNYLARKLKGGDWYLNAQEAVYYGFADCILGEGDCEVNNVK